ncbi:uncharacterized protein TRIADDRAFT_61913 [Trichoplax adhaerens]|uniref:Uncharacterized protein n=1 Tax=Trichoplax adhaerens TaxID=10228 RepID=B3SCB6_TRIAD|nr:predicted protein [Trichoplax adhaerens]EDV19634.1 predicted protein [Trichoplax adhaerens]|eukprot:XP_002117872.1 predicted protein [Trichoplax adhaerens]
MSVLSNQGGKKHFNSNQGQSWRIFGEDEEGRENIPIQTPQNENFNTADSTDDAAYGKARSLKPTPRTYNILYHGDEPKTQSRSGAPSAEPMRAPSSEPMKAPSAEPMRADNPPSNFVNPKLQSMKPTPRTYNILYHDDSEENPTRQINSKPATNPVEAPQPATGRLQSMKPAPRDYNILFHVETTPMNPSSENIESASAMDQNAAMEGGSIYNDSMPQQYATQVPNAQEENFSVEQPDVELPLAERSSSINDFRDPISINDELTARQTPKKTGKLCGYNQGPATMGIVPVTNISNRRNSAEGRKLLEKISFEHNMDSRQEPMHSERGKFTFMRRE